MNVFHHAFYSDKVLPVQNSSEIKQKVGVERFFSTILAGNECQREFTDQNIMHGIQTSTYFNSFFSFEKLSQKQSHAFISMVERSQHDIFKKIDEHCIVHCTVFGHSTEEVTLS